MPLVSRICMGRGNVEKSLRNLVIALSNARTPRFMTTFEKASTMSKRISHNKPSYFSGKRDLALLEVWLREFYKFLFAWSNLQKS